MSPIFPRAAALRRFRAALSSLLTLGFVFCAGAVSAAITVPAVNNPVDAPSNISQWTCIGNCGSSGANGDVGLPVFGGSAGIYGFLSTYTDGTTSANSPLNLADAQHPNTNGSRIVSPTFSVLVGQTLDVWFNYVSTDGKQFSDYAWARAVSDAGDSIYLFTARDTGKNQKTVIPGGLLPISQFDPAATIVDYATLGFNRGNTVSWLPLDGQPIDGCFASNTCGNTGWFDARISFAQAGNYHLEFGVTNVTDNTFNSGLAYSFAGMTEVTPVPEPSPLALIGAGVMALILIGSRRRREPAFM